MIQFLSPTLPGFQMEHLPLSPSPRGNSIWLHIDPCRYIAPAGFSLSHSIPVFTGTLIYSLSFSLSLSLSLSQNIPRHGIVAHAKGYIVSPYSLTWPPLFVIQGEGNKKREYSCHNLPCLLFVSGRRDMEGGRESCP